MRRAVTLLGGQSDLGETLGYSIKRKLLGPPMVNEQLSEERLSKPIALGVLAPDGISSSAYGTEEILIELLKGGLGVAAFTLILPRREERTARSRPARRGRRTGQRLAGGRADAFRESLASVQWQALRPRWRTLTRFPRGNRAGADRDDCAR